jgi:hypothetical protein
VRAPSAHIVLIASLLVHFAAAAILWHAGRAAASTPPLPPPEPTVPSTLIGDSFEVPAEIAPGDPSSPVADISTPTPTATATATAIPTSTATARPASPASSASTSASASASGAAPSPPALFGAVGLRYAVDLVKTFTQSLPQAASADPQWTAIALGSAGDADFTLELDDAGALRHDLEVHGAPSAALKAGILRTVGLIGGRAFTARAAHTHLRITAVVSADTHEDEYHGSRFALTGTGSCTGNVCMAFFALPIGRRIDFTLRLVP